MRPKSQNLSIMITDIQGYTDTSVKSSRKQIIELVENHNRLIRPVIEFYHGSIVKTMGDAFLCTFNSATDAVMCAIVIQLILLEYNKEQQDESKKLKLRIVVNTGDVTLTENDIYGDAVNIAARMEGLECFPGDTIGISESTYLLMNRNEITAEKIGAKELKGIPEAVVVYRVPVGKQKLDQIPARLFELVETVVLHNQGESNNIKDKVTDILKEKRPEHSKKEKEREKNSKNSVMKYRGEIITAFLFLGVGIGFLIDEIAPFAFIGVGLGPLIVYAMAVYKKIAGAFSNDVIFGSFMFFMGIFWLFDELVTGFLIGFGIGYILSLLGKRFSTE